MKWYKYNIRDLSDTEYQKWYSLLDNDKKHRVDGFRFTDDKKRTVIGEMLARKAISEWCNVSVEDIRFGVGEHGKPRTLNLAVEFNISHSGDMVVCAVSDRPVGIDVELLREVKLSTVKHICSKQELDFIFGTGDANIADRETVVRFFKIWTAKEAAAKCAGVGISGLRRIDISNVQQFFIEEEYIVSIKEADI